MSTEEIAGRYRLESRPGTGNRPGEARAGGGEP
jgi:hypothetical protein